MSSKKLVDLVNQWAKFENENPDGDVAQFCHWQLSQNEEGGLVNNDKGYSNEGYSAQLLARLARYAEVYSDDILKEHGIESVYEWGLLMQVLEMYSPKKSELIERQILGFTSGIGIINRLVKRKLLKEVVDKNDKRSKRISLTPAGFDILEATLPDMDKLSHIIFYPLNERERYMLLAILQKLNLVHNNAFDHSQPFTIPQLDENIKNASLSLFDSYKINTKK